MTQPLHPVSKGDYVAGGDGLSRLSIDQNSNEQIEIMTTTDEIIAKSDNLLTESEQSKGGSFMKAARSKALRPFVIISSSYLLFTITDGAIRMIVLLHAYNKSFSALEVAIMFTLYELAGVFTNLAAGVMGAKWGIKVTLISGLSLQLLSYGLLFGWQDGWSKTESLVYVTGKCCHIQQLELDWTGLDLTCARVRFMLFHSGALILMPYYIIFHSGTDVCGYRQGFNQVRRKDHYQTSNAGGKGDSTIQAGFSHYWMEKLTQGGGLLCWRCLASSIL